MPSDVNVDPDGMVWYSTYDFSAIVEEDPVGGTLYQWSGCSERMAEGVYRVWAGSDGTLWVVADAESLFGVSTLHRMVDGELVLDALFLDQIEPTGLGDMAFGPDDQIRAVTSGSGIHYFD